MTRIEVVTWDQATGKVEVDRSWDVTGLPEVIIDQMMKAAKRTAEVFADNDHSTDHVVYARGV